MSVKMMASVWELDLPQGEKLVALAIADHADDQGKCFPSVSRIAWKTGYSERQTQTLIRTLKQRGILDAIAYEKGGRGHSTVYRIQPEKGAKLAPFQKSKKRRLRSRNGETQRTERAKSCAQKGELAIAPQPSLTVNEPSAAHIDQAKIQRASSVLTTDSERQFTSALKKLSREKAFPFPNRPTDPVRSDLFDGIYWKGIENCFVDAQHLHFEEQLREAVRVATTDLAMNRTAKMMALQATDVEKLARQKLRRGLETLQAVCDFSLRIRMARDAVGNAVIESASELLEAQRSAWSQEAVDLHSASNG